jgi:hypothetical protein
MTKTIDFMDFNVDEFYKKMMNAEKDKKELYATMRCLISEAWLSGDRWNSEDEGAGFLEMLEFMEELCHYNRILAEYLLEKMDADEALAHLKTKSRKFFIETVCPEEAAYLKRMFSNADVNTAELESVLG